MAQDTEQSGDAVEYLKNHSDQLVEQLSEYSYLISDALVTILVGVVVGFVLHMLASRFIYPFIAKQRMMRVIFGTLYLMVFVLTALSGLKKDGVDQGDQHFNVAGTVYGDNHRRVAVNDALQCFEVIDTVHVLATHAPLEIPFMLAVVECFIERIAQGQPGGRAGATGQHAAEFAKRDNQRRTSLVENVSVTEVHYRGQTAKNMAGPGLVRIRGRRCHNGAGDAFDSINRD